MDIPQESTNAAETLSKRWCPSHHVYEMNPPGRLLCGPAWKELYQIERELEVENMSPNLAILTLVDQLAEFTIELRHDGVIADPPKPKPKPERPRPSVIRQVWTDTP